MKHVAPLRYDVIFKKAFCDPEIFLEKAMPLPLIAEVTGLREEEIMVLSKN
jgi:hypothetical protein